MSSQGDNVFREQEAAAAGNQQQPQAQTQVVKRRRFIVDWELNSALRLLRVANMLGGIAMIVLGVFSIIDQIGSVNLSLMTLSVYIILFGLIMTCVECNIGNLQETVKTQCGFLFNFWGRTCFIFFAATLCIAVGDLFGYLLGSGLAVICGLNLFVICAHPKFKDGSVLRSWDPYVGYTGGEEEMAAYLRRHPELARKAGQSAVTVARNNPDLARQAAQGAAEQRQQPV